MTSTCDKNYWIATYVPDAGGGGGQPVTPIYRSLTCITTDAYFVHCGTTLNVNGVPFSMVTYDDYKLRLADQTVLESPPTTFLGVPVVSSVVLATTLRVPTLIPLNPLGISTSLPLTIQGTTTLQQDLLIQNADSTFQSPTLGTFLQPNMVTDGSNALLFGATTSGNAGALLFNHNGSTGSSFSVGVYKGFLSRGSLTPRLDCRSYLSTASYGVDVIPRLLLKGNSLIPRRRWGSGQQLTVESTGLRFTISPVTEMRRIVCFFQNIKKNKVAGSTAPLIQIALNTTPITAVANYSGHTWGTQGAGKVAWTDGANGGIMLWNQTDFSTNAADQTFTGVVEFTLQNTVASRRYYAVTGMVGSSINTSTNRPYFCGLAGTVFLDGGDISNVFIRTTSGPYAANQGWFNIFWY